MVKYDLAVSFADLISSGRLSLSIKKIFIPRGKEKKEMAKYVCPVCLYSVEAEEKPEKCIICGAEMKEENK